MPTANAGYHLFNTGDVLTASQVQYNLQNQSIMYFATTGARDTALTGVLAEGMACYIAADQSVNIYNGSAWVSFTGDITALTAGPGIAIINPSGPVPTIELEEGVTDEIEDLKQLDQQELVLKTKIDKAKQKITGANE